MILQSHAQIPLLFAPFHRRQFNTIIPFTLSVTPGAHVNVLQNIDTAAGLTNGARGTIVSCRSAVSRLISLSQHAHGSLFVALSRVRSMDSLLLFGFGTFRAGGGTSSISVSSLSMKLRNPQTTYDRSFVSLQAARAFNSHYFSR